MSDDAVMVADGGDFVATAAYILRFVHLHILLIEDDTSIRFFEFCTSSLFITLISLFLKALYVYSIYVTHTCMYYELCAVHSSHSCLTVLNILYV